MLVSIARAPYLRGRFRLPLSERLQRYCHFHRRGPPVAVGWARHHDLAWAITEGVGRDPVVVCYYAFGEVLRRERRTHSRNLWRFLTGRLRCLVGSDDTGVVHFDGFARCCEGDDEGFELRVSPDLACRDLAFVLASLARVWD